MPQLLCCLFVIGEDYIGAFEKEKKFSGERNTHHLIISLTSENSNLPIKPLLKQGLFSPGSMTNERTCIPSFIQQTLNVYYTSGKIRGARTMN